MGKEHTIAKYITTLEKLYYEGIDESDETFKEEIIKLKEVLDNHSELERYPMVLNLRKILLDIIEKWS